MSVFNNYYAVLSEEEVVEEKPIFKDKIIEKVREKLLQSVKEELIKRINKREYSLVYKTNEIFDLIDEEHEIFKLKETKIIHDLRTTLFQYNDKNGMSIFIIAYTQYGSCSRSCSCCDADIALEEQIYRVSSQKKKELLIQNIKYKIMTMDFFLNKQEALRCFNKKW